MSAINVNNVVTTYKNAESEQESKTILIDPGHGGIDGGASSKDGTIEKNINLNIGLLLGANLKSQGYKVEYTRTEDVGLYTEGKSVKEKKYEDLNKRVSLKEETNCDVFVSIHLNTFPQSSCKGAQVWYSSYNDSERLANIMQNTLKDKLDQSNKREPKAAGTQYKVLRGNDNMAGVIVECGFLSNPEECQKLKDENYQNKIADSLAESISIYLKERGN
jgi:N-acetylmuramoyl-L-alanine amidase